MIWLLPAVESSQIAIIVIISYIVGLGKFAHIMAGSVTILYAVTSGNVSWDSILAASCWQRLLCNIIGGVSLVAALNYGQVASQLKRTL